MTLQDTARAVLAAIATQVASSAVTVGYLGQSTEGVQNTKTAASDLGDVGERGLTTGTVYVDASKLTGLVRGGTITVDGNAAFVTAWREDPAGALFAIEYQDQNPVEGL